MTRPDDEGEGRKSAMAYGAVLALSSSVIVGLILGWLIDRWAGTSPWGIVVGLVAGSGVGFFELFRVMSRIDE